MHELPSDYLAAAKSGGRYPNIRAEIQGAGTITGNDAIIDCRIMRGDSAKPAYFETALALSSECRITVDRRRLDAESGLVSGHKVEVTAFFTDSYGTELGSAKLGTFYITSYDKSDKTNGIITASDRMLYTGVDFNPEALTYPCAISDMLAGAFQQSGLTVSGIELPIDPNILEAAYKSETPVTEGMRGNPYSCRDVIARIAGMNLGAMYIDAEEVPKLYGYQSAGTLNNENILDMRIGSETYYIEQVLVYKTEERMAKKKNGYRQLPYAPRFENMDEIGTGSEWLAQIRAAASRIRNKPWTTATVTIQGVGQIEPGDFVTADETTLFVTGISYDFSNAHFTETLYSYAYTEEEYYMAPQKTVDVTTGSEKTVKGGVGENVGFHNERFNSYEGDDANTINGGSSSNDYNHAEGKKNTINECSCTYVGGSGNTASGLYDSGFVHGSRNTAQGASNAAVFGYGNKLGGSHFSFIAGGDSNEVNSSPNCEVSGAANKAYGCYATVVGGNGNTVQGCSSTAVFGQAHKVTNFNQGLVVGDGCDTSTLSVSNVVLLTSSNRFCVTHAGAVYASQGYNSMGADYAEYFEWADGNPDNEYRCGMLVALDGDKIVPADGYDILGAVSANPSVVGNSADLHWKGKYARDVYGRVITAPNGSPLISPDFDPALKYIPRSERPEWAAVGLVGRLVVCDNGSCKPGGYVSARNGIGTASLRETRAWVLQRIDSTHVEVLIK